MSRRDCEARQHGDEMQCGRCGLTWATNDPERPACAPRIDKRAIPTRAATVAVARLEGAEALNFAPVELTSHPNPERVRGNYVFSSGAVDAIPRLPEDRRFWVTEAEARRTAEAEEMKAAYRAAHPGIVEAWKKAVEAGPLSPGFVRPGACAHCGRLPGEEPCDWIECAALSPAPPRLNGCHSKPRPVAGSVTHWAQDGYYPPQADPDEPGVLVKIGRFVEVRHVMTVDCGYDKSATDPGCKGCPWARS